ncbi:M23 family metallopeptidase [Georgenia satyanarayanai]|uniref:M23 family metallopeptidase n=1 Tax=Georgenia satyanarayanai TaxID=860221 RepID=UPI00255A030C|nr:peptidoglycan DD-metalloendopeptidase family protein [Georgenia satyanarayanai]
MSLTAGGMPAPTADAPATGLGGLARLRRAGLVGCAALLVGTTALTTAGTAVPSPTKVPGGAFVTANLTLEAEPVDAFGLGLGLGGGLGGGVTLVAESVATLKAHTDPFTDSPLCASYPVAPGTYRVTSPYGYRTHPIFGSYSLHTGVDFAAPLGTPIHAVTDGTVVYTGAGRLGRSSELVIIEHTVRDTTFYSWYVHMYPDGVFVEPGQHVRAGEVIAEVGSNGNSTGPHLHFEIHTSDAGLGLTKTPVTRTSTAMVLSAVPSPGVPSDDASEDPSKDPTDDASEDPSKDPTDDDSKDPSKDPTDDASEDPSEEPTEDPSEEPTEDPSEEPTEDPSEEPSDDPSEEPTDKPSEQPSEEPSEQPSEIPSPEPSGTPSAEPTEDPSKEPTEEPSEEPSDEPSASEPRPRNPFPTRAYGTTVDPLPFLASLGLTLVAPSQCTAS